MNESIFIEGKEFKSYKYNRKYYISKDGQVYSDFSKRIIKNLIEYTKGKHYHIVDMYIDGKQRHKKVHRLVYETWGRELLPHEQVNHRDDDSLNNHIDNLYVGTQKENIQDCLKNGNRVGSIKKLILRDKDTNEILTFVPAREFVSFLGLTDKNGGLVKVLKRDWIKEKYEVIEFSYLKDLQEYNELKGVTTNGDECSHVG